MESVASMDAADRAVMSDSFGDEPWLCDAGGMTWCSRPRLYWISWTLQEHDGVTLLGGEPGSPRRKPFKT